MHLEDIDRGMTLRGLLDAIDMERLDFALRVLLGEGMRMVDDTGALVVGHPSAHPGFQRAPLTVLMNPLGYIESDASGERLAAAAIFVEGTLDSAARYLMATDLHEQAVHTDYDTLLRKHEALEESEQRYRALSESLERRVQEQVRTIEGTQRQLYQSENIASVGRLGAGMAHEINNPIGFIKSNLVSARSYVKTFASFCNDVHNASDLETVQRARQSHRIEFLLEDFESLLEESVEGADRIALIVASLKEFSNADRAEEQVVDINQIIRATCAMLSSQIQPNVKIHHTAGVLPKTRCRPGKLGQVFMNMILNGAQALEGAAGDIHVHTGAVNDEIVVHVVDSGIGIAEPQLRCVFDPFFTTREVGAGVGLGLTVSRDIVESHGGSIAVASQLGVGTTFVIHLPIRK